MKSFIFFLFLLLNSCASGKEINYTSSTPAGNHVRNFLGISQTDSVDFIRWNLKIINLTEFELSCSYGIGKPNTNGFIDKKDVSLKGKAELANHILSLHANGKSLGFRMLNHNILHLLNEDRTLMKGNDGWSYTLNAVDKIATKEINISPVKTSFSDSIVFSGRTPCRVIGDILYDDKSPNCYKIKWLVSLYKENPDAVSGIFKTVRNTHSGTWKLQSNDPNHFIYRLELKNGKHFDLVQVDENIVYILDQNNEILVGDLDFSYSLTKR
jgi:hypothetical protein